MKKYYLGIILVISSALGYGIMPIFALYAYDYGINVNTLLFLRFLISASFMLGYVYLAGKGPGITFKQLRGLGMAGILFTACSGFLFNAIKLIPASLAVLILYVHPILIALISSVYHGDRFNKRTIFSIILSFASLILVLGVTFNSVSLKGIIFAMLCSLAYTFYIILGKELVKDVPPLAASGYVSLFASLSFLIMALWSSNMSFDFSPKAYIPLLGIVGFSTILALTTYFKGLEIVGPTLASTLSMIDPLTTILLSMILFKEVVTPPQLLGIAGVLAGSTLVVASKKSVSQDAIQTNA